MKSLSRILLMLLFFLIFIEIIWFNCDSTQRQKLLEILGRNDLAREIQLDPYYPILPQLYKLRLQDFESSQPGNKLVDNEERFDWHGMGHDFVATELCNKPEAKNLDNRSRQKIYKWVDDEGRPHFGEKPNSENNYEFQDLSKNYRALKQVVKISIEYPGWAGDSQLESEIKKQSRLVYKVLNSYIPKIYQRQVNVKIVLFKNSSTFAQYRSRQSTNTRLSGYYSSKTNTIYLPRFQNVERTLAIVRHEMTHSVLAGMLGTIPAWINEGLAEYMESFVWQLNSAVAQPNVDQYHLLRARSMKFLANTDRLDFYGIDQKKHYLHAQASMYFLLDHQEGKAWLKRTFNFYGKNSCEKLSAEQLFSKNYPGGLNAASSNFTAWLNKGKYGKHYY